MTDAPGPARSTSPGLQAGLATGQEPRPEHGAGSPATGLASSFEATLAAVASPRASLETAPPPRTPTAAGATSRARSIGTAAGATSRARSIGTAAGQATQPPAEPDAGQPLEERAAGRLRQGVGTAGVKRAATSRRDAEGPRAAWGGAGGAVGAGGAGDGPRAANPRGRPRPRRRARALAGSRLAGPLRPPAPLQLGDRPQAPELRRPGGTKRAETALGADRALHPEASWGLGAPQGSVRAQGPDAARRSPGARGSVEAGGPDWAPLPSTRAADGAIGPSGAADVREGAPAASAGPPASPARGPEMTAGGTPSALHSLSGPVARQLALRLGRPVAGPDGTTKLSLNLHPPELGGVRATITLSAGRLEVDLTASTAEGHAALSKALPELARWLSQGKGSAAVSLAAFGEPESGREKGHAPTRRRAPAGEAIGPADRLPPASREAPAREPSGQIVAVVL
jgi:flagellar hook-length control protein FliK